MAKSLDGLVAVMVARRNAQRTSKCRTCRNEKIAADTDRALDAAIKFPDKYRGLSIPSMWEWSGARDAGIGVCAYRVHITGHRADKWKLVSGGVK